MFYRVFNRMFYTGVLLVFLRVFKCLIGFYRVFLKFF